MKTKKLLAALLSSAMVLGTMAVPVFAANVADANDFKTAVANGGEVTLTGDVELTSTVEITKDVTIYLNDHNITAKGARALHIKSGNVTITGSGTISASGNIDSSSSVIRVGDNTANDKAAKLTIDQGVTVSSNLCYGVTVFGVNDTDNNKATSDIEFVLNYGGSVSVSGEQAAISGNGTNTLSATTMTINGTVSATNDYAIYHPGKGTLTINDGATVNGYGGIEAKGGTVIINGGEITAAAADATHKKINNNGTSTSGYALVAVNNKNYIGNATFEVENGTISGAVDIIDDYEDPLTASISISGGTFSTSVADYVAAGSVEAQSNGKYVVGSKTAPVSDGTYSVRNASDPSKHDTMQVGTKTVTSTTPISYKVTRSSDGLSAKVTSGVNVTSGTVQVAVIITGIPEGETVTVTID